MERNVQFLNIEYIFNRMFDVYLWFKYIVLFKILGTSVPEYLADHRALEYDGLRDRFGLYNDPFATKVAGVSQNVTAASSDATSTGFSSIFRKIFSFFGGGDGSASAALATSGDTASNLYQFLTQIRGIMTLLALILISILIYSLIRWKEVVNAYFEKYKKSHTPKVLQTPMGTAQVNQNTKWATIESYMTSSDSGQWRLAILEADSLLADLLKTLPIPGIDVGEKLTNADRKKFQTLDDAWEAHKIRNRIAHDGSEYVLTEHTARNTIQKFKNVFTEFQFGM